MARNHEFDNWLTNKSTAFKVFLDTFKNFEIPKIVDTKTETLISETIKQISKYTPTQDLVKEFAKTDKIKEIKNGKNGYINLLKEEFETAQTDIGNSLFGNSETSLLQAIYNVSYRANDTNIDRLKEKFKNNLSKQNIINVFDDLEKKIKNTFEGEDEHGLLKMKTCDINNQIANTTKDIFVEKINAVLKTGNKELKNKPLLEPRDKITKNVLDDLKKNTVAKIALPESYCKLPQKAPSWNPLRGKPREKKPYCASGDGSPSYTFEDMETLMYAIHMLFEGNIPNFDNSEREIKKDQFIKNKSPDDISPKIYDYLVTNKRLWLEKLSDFHVIHFHTFNKTLTDQDVQAERDRFKKNIQNTFALKFNKVSKISNDNEIKENLEALICHFAEGVSVLTQLNIPGTLDGIISELSNNNNDEVLNVDLNDNNIGTDIKSTLIEKSAKNTFKDIVNLIKTDLQKGISETKFGAISALAKIIENKDAINAKASELRAEKEAKKELQREKQRKEKLEKNTVDGFDNNKPLGELNPAQYVKRCYKDFDREDYIKVASSKFCDPLYVLNIFKPEYTLLSILLLDDPTDVVNQKYHLQHHFYVCLMILWVIETRLEETRLEENKTTPTDPKVTVPLNDVIKKNEGNYKFHKDPKLIYIYAGWKDLYIHNTIGKNDEMPKFTFILSGKGHKVESAIEKEKDIIDFNTYYTYPDFGFKAGDKDEYYTENIVKVLTLIFSLNMKEQQLIQQRGTDFVFETPGDSFGTNDTLLTVMKNKHLPNLNANKNYSSHIPVLSDDKVHELKAHYEHHCLIIMFKLLEFANKGLIESFEVIPPPKEGYDIDNNATQTNKIRIYSKNPLSEDSSKISIRGISSNSRPSSAKPGTPRRK